MSKEKPSTIVYPRTDETRLVTPRLPLSSYQLDWNGIQVEHHRQPAWEIPEHSNAQHVVVVHHSGTQVERVLNGRRRSELVLKGNVVMIPASVLHKSSWYLESEVTLLMLEPTLLAQIAHESVDPHRVELLPQFAKPDPLIYGIGLSLKSALASNGRCDRLYVDSLTTTLSIHLLRSYCSREQTIQKYDNGLPWYRLNQVLEYINVHLDQEIRLLALAEVLDMSQYHFCKLFKQSMGIAPYQYVIQQRVERAKQLLKVRDLSIADIALQCGFTNQSHLTKHFRQLTGITPKAYRRIS